LWLTEYPQTALWIVFVVSVSTKPNISLIQGVTIAIELFRKTEKDEWQIVFGYSETCVAVCGSRSPR
jgi:hypothetical protein